jgi:hypothetical protein
MLNYLPTPTSSFHAEPLHYPMTKHYSDPGRAMQDEHIWKTNRATVLNVAITGRNYLPCSSHGDDPRLDVREERSRRVFGCSFCRLNAVFAVDLCNRGGGGMEHSTLARDEGFQAIIPNEIAIALSQLTGVSRWASVTASWFPSPGFASVDSGDGQEWNRVRPNQFIDCDQRKTWVSSKSLMAPRIDRGCRRAMGGRSQGVR